MALVPFNRQQKLMNSWLNEFFGSAWPSLELPADSFKLDVREELMHYTVEAEIPGVKKEDVGIDFQDGKLTISVNHAEQSDEENKKFIHRERCYTSTQRSVYLADAAGTGITAGLEDGLLRVTVPKNTESEKKSKIEIE